MSSSARPVRGQREGLTVCLNCGIVMDPPIFDRDKVPLPCSHLRMARFVEAAPHARAVAERVAEEVRAEPLSKLDAIRDGNYWADFIESLSDSALTGGEDG